MSKQDQADQLRAMRHSLAHIMATATQQLWPAVKFGIGPTTDQGFYYDIDLGKDKLSEEDFGKLEAKMAEVIKADLPFEQFISRLMKRSSGPDRLSSLIRKSC